MTPKISIILPVYQVEDYIENTILSIANQKFQDFEVVLVDDGSTDKSIEIAEKILLDKEINYFTIKQDNGGVSRARNEGIKKSNGEWIVCIDSDDVISENFLLILYDACIERQVEVSIGNFQSVNQNSLFKRPKKYYESEIVDQDTMLDLFLRRKIKIISPAMLIKKKIIIDKNLYYNEEMHFSEDQHFIWRILFSVEKCAYNKTKIYNYLSRPSSTMTSSGIKKIMTGYYGFNNFTTNFKYHTNENLSSFIISRWVFGALRASAKILEFKEYKMLANKMNYRKKIRVLLVFSDEKVKLLSLIMLCNLKLFYLISRKW